LFAWCSGAGEGTGEIARRPTEIDGIAVHLASRVHPLARSDEILLSGTAADFSSAPVSALQIAASRR
jgi:class 3 adenylate cyclase